MEPNFYMAELYGNRLGDWTGLGTRRSVLERAVIREEEGAAPKGATPYSIPRVKKPRPYSGAFPQPLPCHVSACTL
jgi:hypothetical protein